MDVVTSSYLLGLGLVIAAPTLILFGWLSDQIGRKPVILSGFLIAALTYYPLYSSLGRVTQPDHVNQPAAILIIAVLVSHVGMVYGPIGAFLAEYFPASIRYTSVSVPYHIGNGWGGGLVPFVTSAPFQATGSLGYALLYPIRLLRALSLAHARDAAHQQMASDGRRRGALKGQVRAARNGLIDCAARWIYFHCIAHATTKNWSLAKPCRR